MSDVNIFSRFEVGKISQSKHHEVNKVKPCFEELCDKSILDNCSPSQKMPSRTRKPRLVVGLNGMIPKYSASQAAGQELLLSFDHSGTEMLVSNQLITVYPACHSA